METIMFKVEMPEAFNETWARAFNSRDMDNLLALYEDDAVLADPTRTVRGKKEIAELLRGLMSIPGTLSGRNNFCLRHGDLALLRADWILSGPDGNPIMSGSSAEIIRRLNQLSQATPGVSAVPASTEQQRVR
jgi:ketosteroid isomerase-like protein